MTIEERIKLEEEAIKDIYFKEKALDGLPGYMVTKEDYEECRKSINEHQQLVEWLKELKAHREAWNKLHEEITEYKNRGFFGVGVEDLETGKQTALDWVLGAMENLTLNGEI